MRNRAKDITYFDQHLKQLNQDIIWKETRKRRLENKIVMTMNRNRNKKRIFTGVKYASSIGVFVVLLLVSYHFLSDTIHQQGGGITTGNQDNQGIQGDQTHNPPIIDDKNDDDEVGKDTPVQDKNLEIEIGSTETVTRIVEGHTIEVEVINYHIPAYGITYQFDEALGVPQVNENQIKYSLYDGEYKIILEIMEQTNLETAISILQEKFETDGYVEKLELESTPFEENGLIGKMQNYYNPYKGFIAYEIGEHALTITFEFPLDAGDSMYPALENLRKSIHIQK